MERYLILWLQIRIFKHLALIQQSWKSLLFLSIHSDQWVREGRNSSALLLLQAHSWNQGFYFASFRARSSFTARPELTGAGNKQSSNADSNLLTFTVSSWLDWSPNTSSKGWRLPDVRDRNTNKKCLRFPATLFFHIFCGIQWGIRD